MSTSDYPNNQQAYRDPIRPTFLLKEPFDTPRVPLQGTWGSEWGEYQPDKYLPDPDTADMAQRSTGVMPALPAQPPASPCPPACLYVVDSYGMESLAIDKQPTWIIPAIQVQAEKKAVPQAAESYPALIRKLVTNSGIYALASLVSPLVSLVLAPFLTRHLSHTEYGMLMVLNPTIALVAGITQFGLGIAFFRAYSQDYADSPRDRLAVLSTAVLLLLLIVAPGSLVMMLIAPLVSNLLFRSDSFSGLIVIAAQVVLLQNLAVPGFSWLRAESRALLFAILSVLNLLVTLGATVLLVGVFSLGVSGALFAMAGGYGIVVICTLPLMLRRSGICLRFDIARNLLTFGISTLPGLLSVWVLQLSDRYLLMRFGSLAQMASYAVAYTLGSALGPLMIVPFSLAWYSLFYTIAKKENAQEIFRLVFRWYSLLLLLAVFGISLLAIFLLDDFFPPAYHSAQGIIPFVTLSSMFYGLFDVVVVGVYIRRKLRFNFIFTPVAALVNILCNLALIPAYGALGAALATLIAYCFLAVLAYLVNQKIYPLPFEIGLFALALLIGALLYVGNWLLIRDQGSYVSWGISFCALCLYAACLVFLGKLPARRSAVGVVS